MMPPCESKTPGHMPANLNWPRKLTTFESPRAPQRRWSRIPAPQSTAAHNLPMKKPTPQPAKDQVLIVDDDITIRGILSETLVGRGYEVCVAPRVEDVRAFYKAIEPRVVLLDWKLSDGDGLQLLPEIKRRWPATEVIMMTGYGAEQIAERAAELGACLVINKPFSLDDLILAVRSACRPQAPKKTSPPGLSAN